LRIGVTSKHLILRNNLSSSEGTGIARGKWSAGVAANCDDDEGTDGAVDLGSLAIIAIRNPHSLPLTPACRVVALAKAGPLTPLKHGRSLYVLIPSPACLPSRSIAKAGRAVLSRRLVTP